MILLASKTRDVSPGPPYCPAFQTTYLYLCDDKYFVAANPGIATQEIDRTEARNFIETADIRFVSPPGA